MPLGEVLESIKKKENGGKVSLDMKKADAETLRAMLEAELHPQRIIIHTIGPVIGAHSGPGTLALFFVGSRR